MKRKKKTINILNIYIYKSEKNNILFIYLFIIIIIFFFKKKYNLIL